MIHKIPQFIRVVFIFTIWISILKFGNHALGNSCQDISNEGIQTGDQHRSVSQDQRHEEAGICSIFRNMLFNAKAWETGDVLIKEELGFDAVNYDGKLNYKGMTLNQTIFHRITFDFPNNRIRVLSRGVANTLDLERQSRGLEGLAEKTFSSGIVVPGNGTIYIRDFPERKIEKQARSSGHESKNDVADPLNFPNLPDYRCVGFGIKGYPTAIQQMEQRIDVLASGKDFRKFERLGDFGLEISFGGLISAGEDYGGTYSVRFDLKTNMPVEWRNGWVSEKTVNGSRQGELSESRFKWEEIQGVFVPKSYFYNAPFEQYEVGNLRQEWGSLTRKTDFHWFSFNDEISPNEFNSSCMDNLEDFMKLLDPEKNNAFESSGAQSQDR